jgi:breast cancer 2 susceptibility protein
MFLTKYQVYPVAYLEFVEDEDGKKHRQGPRTEKDENALQDRWKVSHTSL